MKLKHAATVLIGLGFLGSALAQTTTAQTDVRLLASGCFQCHGTNGNGGFDSLAGENAADLLHKMSDFRLKSARSDIMAPHARGYTDAQLKLIADYFSKLPKP